MTMDLRGPRALTVLALTLALGSGSCCGAQASDAPAGGMPAPFRVAAADQSRLGVVTRSLAAAAAPPGVTTTARVLDPGPLIQLDGELSAAEASLAAARAEAERTRRLYEEDRTASARALEAADAQAQAQQQRASGARRRLLLEWGEGVAGLSAARRAALLNELARVRAELVRIELPPGAAAPAPGAAVRVQGGPGGAPLEARVLGLLPVADPRLQTRGVLAELTGPQASLAVGQMLTAQLPMRTAAASGVVIPRSALLRRDAGVWVYVQTSPETFVRREVSKYQPLAAGWFVPLGFAPGERIVTAGAAALMDVEAAAAGGAD